MKIIFHTGAHCTDEDRLLKCLLRNADTFLARGVAVPGPSRYRKLLDQAVRAMKTSAPAPDAREVLLDSILDEDFDKIDRLILSFDHLFGRAPFSMKNSVFYQAAHNRMALLNELFATDDVEMFFALRNPATYVPAAAEKARDRTFADITEGLDLNTLRWSEFIQRMRNALPEMPLTVWCNEDTPLIWAQIIREMAGLNPNEKIIGGFDLLSEIMNPEGMKRFRSYLKTHPNMTEIQKRRVMVAFLDKFADPDKLEEEFDLPGWTTEIVQYLTDIYEEDVYEISRLPGVNMICSGSDVI